MGEFYLIKWKIKGAKDVHGGRKTQPNCVVQYRFPKILKKTQKLLLEIIGKCDMMAGSGAMDRATLLWILLVTPKQRSAYVKDDNCGK